jgi:hypothetical protein
MTSSSNARLDISVICKRLSNCFTLYRDWFNESSNLKKKIYVEREFYKR